MLDDLLSLNEVLLLPPLEWRIEDLLPKAGIMLIGGDPKLGKSTLTLDLVLRGVRGLSAFGRYKQFYNKVLVVNVEGKHQGIKMRDRMYNTISPAIRSKIIISGKPLKFTLPTGAVATFGMEALEIRIKQEGFDLVVLDPLVSFHTGDENNSQQMVAILDALRDIGDHTGAGFIILHHTRKIGSQQTLEDAIDSGGAMLRGAGGIFGAVDCAVMLWPGDSGRVKRLVTFSARYARGDTSPIDLQMDRNTMRMYRVFDDVPDPIEWENDNGGQDWDKYTKAFGLGADALAKAQHMVAP